MPRSTIDFSKFGVNVISKAKPITQTIWLKVNNSKYIIVKFFVNDGQLWVPKEIVKNLGNHIKLYGAFIKEGDLFMIEDDLYICCCNKNMCKTTITRKTSNSVILIGILVSG